MRRRRLIGGMAGLVLGSTANAQAPASPLIGFISSRSETDSAHLLAAFRRGLADGGFIEGRNVTIRYHWAEGHYDRLPAFAADLVGRQPALLVAVGGEPSALAAKAATAGTIPMVFTVGGDPVKSGLVDSLSRPGNVTGVSLLTTAPEAKRLQLLNDFVPSAIAVAVLVNPDYQEAAAQERELEMAAKVLGKRLQFVRARHETELDQAFETMVQSRPQALVATADPFFDTQRDRIVGFANRQRLPAIFQFREYAVAGGLMSYGVSITEGYYQVGIYASKILKGTRPDELPIQQSIKFELVINARTAMALGLDIPMTLLGRADEVIE